MEEDCLHLILLFTFLLQVSRDVMLWFPAIAPLWSVPHSLHFLSENTPAASPPGAYMSSAGFPPCIHKTSGACGLWDLCHPAADGDSSFDSCSLLDNSEMDTLCGIPRNTSSCREGEPSFDLCSSFLPPSFTPSLTSRASLDNSFKKHQ